MRLCHDRQNTVRDILLCSQIVFTPSRSLTGLAAVNYPIRHGIVENWDNMERYWHRCIFKYLRCDPEVQYITPSAALQT